MAAPVQNLLTPVRRAVVAAPSNATALSSTQERKFAALVHGLTIHGDWVGMSDFLKAVQEPRRHTKRYLDGKTPSKCWKVGGKLPRVNTDWKMLKGRHGGGSGDGLPHVRVSFLKAVWAKHCSHRA